MKLILLLAATCVVVTWGKPAGRYADQWDSVNVGEDFGADPLIKDYIDCLLDNGRCTPDGKALKETLLDALQNGCNRHMVKRQTGQEAVIRNLRNRRIDTYQQVSTNYDPENVNRERFRGRI